MEIKSIYGNPVCDDVARKDIKKLKDDYDIIKSSVADKADKVEMEEADRRLANSISQVDMGLCSLITSVNDNKLAISQKASVDDLEFYVKRDIEFHPYSISAYGDTDFDEIAKSSVLGRVNRKWVSESTYIWNILYGDKVCCRDLDELTIGITNSALSQTDFDDFVASIHFTSTENTVIKFIDGSVNDYVSERHFMTGEDCIDNEFVPVANKRYNITATYDGMYFIYYVSGVELS